MLMGLTNALTTFQGLINSVLYPFLDKFIFIYLNDVLIYFETLKEY